MLFQKKKKKIGREKVVKIEIEIGRKVNVVRGVKNRSYR